MEIVPKRKWQYPIAIEREYAKYLAAYVQKEMEIVESFLPEIGEAVYRNGIRTDGFGDWLGNLVDKVQRKVKQKLSALPVLNKIFKQVNQHVNVQLIESYESLYGNRPRQFNNTKEFETLKTIWTSQNVALIKSIDDQIMDKVRFSMSQRIKEQTIAGLAKDIKDIAKVSENRAVLIATDQVGKLNSQLTQYRQMNAGIEQYMWLSQHDNRVRPKHRAPYRDGNIYRWDDPPPDGHPGWPIRCRCVAAPVFDTNKIGLNPRANTFKNARENAIIKEKLKRYMKEHKIYGDLAYPAPQVDVTNIPFDAYHVNEERNHGVTETEARHFIKNAVFAIYRQNERYANFYSVDGAAYLATIKKKQKIRTAVKGDEYAKTYRDMLEVIKNAI